jgi:hypothetical protein
MYEISKFEKYTTVCSAGKVVVIFGRGNHAFVRHGAKIKGEICHHLTK